MVEAEEGEKKVAERHVCPVWVTPTRASEMIGIKCTIPNGFLQIIIPSMA